MAEIKSTIDLVMERTRNLTMSEADRREQSAAEFRDGVSKLIMEYLEGGLDVGRFQRELLRLKRDFPEVGIGAAVFEIGRRIAPDTDNGALLKLLREGCEKDVGGIERTLGDYSAAVEELAAGVTEEILEDLRSRGISGSAVIPNLAAGAGFSAKLQELTDKFQKKIAAEVERMSTGG